MDEPDTFPEFVDDDSAGEKDYPAKVAKVAKVGEVTEEPPSVGDHGDSAGDVSNSAGEKDYLAKVAKVAKVLSSFDDLLVILTLAIHDTRVCVRPPTANGRRTSAEDGLAVARCMDVLDALSKTEHPDLAYARRVVTEAALLIRQWNFFAAYRALDRLRPK